MTEHQKLENPSGVERLVIEYLSQTHSLAYAYLTPDLRIGWNTPNFINILLDAPSQIQGQLLPDVLWEFVGAEQALDRILKGEEPNFTLDRVNRSLSDGSVGYFRFLVLPIDPHQPSKGLLLIVEDTTQEGRLEQLLVQDRNELRLTQVKLAKAYADLEHLNHLKSLFLSIAAHDMRAPLATILGYVELLRAKSTSPDYQKQADFLSIIASQVVHLDRLISDFIDLDRLEQGKFSIQPENCDLNPLFKQIIHTMMDTAARQGLSIKQRYEANRVTVTADPARVKQILYNLLSNAFKYTSSGGQIDIRLWAEAGYSVFEVQDTGTGMTADELNNLFTLYYRTDKARKSKTSGTGLGLFIVKALVDAHNGQIQVSSQPGVGTTFTVRIPLAET